MKRNIAGLSDSLSFKWKAGDNPQVSSTSNVSTCNHAPCETVLSSSHGRQGQIK
jgi:hypothetical protein